MIGEPCLAAENLDEKNNKETADLFRLYDLIDPYKVFAKQFIDLIIIRYLRCPWIVPFRTQQLRQKLMRRR